MAGGEAALVGEGVERKVDGFNGSRGRSREGEKKYFGIKNFKWKEGEGEKEE